MAVKIVRRAKVMLTIRSRSIKVVGRGTKMMIKTIKTASTKRTSRFLSIQIAICLNICLY
jgi:hypothetical protein